MSQLPTLLEIEAVIAENGLGIMAQAGVSALRGARAESRANEITLSDGVAAQDSELVRNWSGILKAAGTELAAGALEDYRRRLDAIPPKQVLIGAALLEELGPEPQENAPRHLRKRWNDEKRRMLRIGLFWGPLSYGDVSKFTTGKYRAACARIPNGKGGKKVGLAYTTVKTELEYVQRAVKNYAKANHIGFYPVLDVPKEKVIRDYYLLRSEDARILWACRGRVWNRATNDWVKTVGEDGRLVNHIDEETRANSHGIGRIIVTEIYTAWRDENMRLATWERHPSHGTLDPDNRMLYRTGQSRPATKKNKFPSSRMLPRMEQHSARWKKADEREGHDFIFRQIGGEPYARITWQYNQIIEAAGLDAEVVLHTHRHSLATWCAHMGIPVEATAKLIGVTPKTLARVYQHFSPTTEETAVEMWRDPKCRAKLRTLTRGPDPKGIKFNGAVAPKRAPPRKVDVLQRVRNARSNDAAVRQ